jgi:DNA-binding transcriptional MocR family regulator
MLRFQLADEIIRGMLAPGTALDETELARRFQVSRTPVREAIRQLAASGLVENPSETWAGRGLRLRWLAVALKSGKKLEDFRIAALERRSGRPPRKLAGNRLVLSGVDRSVSWTTANRPRRVFWDQIGRGSMPE